VRFVRDRLRLARPNRFAPVDFPEGRLSLAPTLLRERQVSLDRLLDQPPAWSLEKIRQSVELLRQVGGQMSSDDTRGHGFNRVNQFD
jgi:hypothetical protein